MFSNNLNFCKNSYFTFRFRAILTVVIQVNFPFKVPPLHPVFTRIKNYCIIVFLLFFLLFSGCSHAQFTAKEGNMVQSLRFAYQANFSSDPEVVPEYEIGYNDLLEVKFFNNPQFNETVRVRPDGRITLQKVGELFVIGKTPTEVKKIIEKTYRKILKKPEITVFVREFGGMNFYVLGVVKNPGNYPYAKNMTLLQAIATAGGYAPGAKQSSVFLIRKQKDGYFYVSRFNLDMDNPLKTVSQNVFVEPFDIIYVPKTFYGKTTDFLRNLFEGYLPPLDLYLQWKSKCI